MRASAAPSPPPEPMSAQPSVTSLAAFRRMLWAENPVLVQILGICSALAVTNLVKNTFIMCLGLIFTTAMSSFTVSLLRDRIPRRVRMMIQLLVIASYVIVIQTLLDAFAPAVARQLGPYVGLIITNCIVMGRAEAFAMGNRPVPAFWDGCGAGLGYSGVLLLLAAVREPLGMGTFCGVPLGFMAHWTRCSLMVVAPAGFFGLAALLWIARSRR